MVLLFFSKFPKVQHTEEERVVLWTCTEPWPPNELFAYFAAMFATSVANKNRHWASIFFTSITVDPHTSRCVSGFWVSHVVCSADVTAEDIRQPQSAHRGVLGLSLCLRLVVPLSFHNCFSAIGLFAS